MTGDARVKAGAFRRATSGAAVVGFDDFSSGQRRFLDNPRIDALALQLALIPRTIAALVAMFHDLPLPWLTASQ